MRRIVIAAVLAAVCTIGLVGPAEAAPDGHKWWSVASGFGYRADWSQYNGATSELGFRQSTGTKGRTANAWLIEAAIDLPAGWANHYGAWAELRVNGLTIQRTAWQPDTNGDARLEYYFGDLWLRRGDRVSVWFSDPVTRYVRAHPEIRA